MGAIKKKMKLALNKILLLGILVFGIALLGLALRNAPFTKGNLDTYAMPLLTANDVAYFTSHSKYAYDSGMPIFDSPSITGGVENVIGTYPPLMYTFSAAAMHMANILSDVSPYQLVFLLVCLLAVLAPLYGFVIIRRYFNTEVALIVLALALIPPTLFLFPLYIGFWADIFSFAPAIAALFFIKEVWHGKSKLPLLLFAILSAAAAIGHAFEFMYALFFLCLTILFLIIRKVERRAFSNILITFIIICLLLAPYLLRFNVVNYGAGNTFRLGEVRAGPPDYFPKVQFGFIFIAGTVLGALVIFFMALQKKLTKYQAALLMFPLFIVGIVLGRYVGIENLQTYRQLYHGYFFLLLPAAIGVSGLLSILREKLVSKQLAALILVALLCILIIPTYTKSSSEMAQIKQSTLMREAEWESLMWVRDNTPADSKVMILFGLYGQGLDYYSERIITAYPNDEATLAEFCFPPKDSFSTFPLTSNADFRINFISPENPYFNVLKEDMSISQEKFDFTGWLGQKKMDSFDYVMVRYLGTQIDNCMQSYIRGMLDRGHSLAWQSNQIVILKVNKNATRPTD